MLLQLQLTCNNVITIVIISFNQIRKGFNVLFINAFSLSSRNVKHNNTRNLPLLSPCPCEFIDGVLNHSENHNWLSLYSLARSTQFDCWILLAESLNCHSQANKPFKPLSNAPITDLSNPMPRGEKWIWKGKMISAPKKKIHTMQWEWHFQELIWPKSKCFVMLLSPGWKTPPIPQISCLHATWTSRKGKNWKKKKCQHGKNWTTNSFFRPDWQENQWGREMFLFLFRWHSKTNALINGNGSGVPPTNAGDCWIVCGNN